MEPIRDFSWSAQMAHGSLERFELNGWAVCAVGDSHGAAAAKRSGSATFRFRLLFSEAGDQRPIYAVNLESTILGAWVVSEQEGAEHHIVRRLSGPLRYDEFRIIALERAVEHLGRRQSAAQDESFSKDLRKGDRYRN